VAIWWPTPAGAHVLHQPVDSLHQQVAYTRWCLQQLAAYSSWWPTPAGALHQLVVYTSWWPTSTDGLNQVKADINHSDLKVKQAPHCTAAIQSTA